MALKEQDIVFTTTDEAGNPVIQFPITRVENVEDAVRTVNKKKPDSNGDIQIDVDMSHLATKDELTKGLANKRDHTIQIANADLNTLLEDKTWACSGTLRNAPITCTFCIVQAYDTGVPISGNIVQVCYVPNQTDNTVRTFWRNCNNGVTFGKWSESGAVKTVNSIAPDASGEVTLPNATTSKFGLVRLAAEEDVLNEAPQTAVCTQLIYEINEFRRKSTAYQVGDKVDCAFQYERFLECTKAGTTSADLLDTRSVTHGQVIADGTVEWTVRTHVRSVNGNVAGADGNVLVDVGVKTVNGKGPDGSGNVAIASGDAMNDEILAAADKAISDALTETGGTTTADLLSAVSRVEAGLAEKLPSSTTHIVKSWANGDSWYRKYSDGWIEQGGRAYLTTKQEKAVAFPNAFGDNKYCISFTVERDTSTSSEYTDDTTVMLSSPSTTSFTAYMFDAGNNSYSTYVRWFACGY